MIPSGECKRVCLHPDFIAFYSASCTLLIFLLLLFPSISLLKTTRLLFSSWPPVLCSCPQAAWEVGIGLPCSFFSSLPASLFSLMPRLIYFPCDIMCQDFRWGNESSIFSSCWVEDQLWKNIGNSQMEIKMSAFTSDKAGCWVQSLPLRDPSGGRQA